MGTKKKKSEQLYTCTAPSCGEKYPAKSGGTIGPEGLCPAHYQQRRRNPDAELRPIAERNGETRTSLKVYLTRRGRDALEARAKKTGVSLSHLCAQLLEA